MRGSPPRQPVVFLRARPAPSSSFPSGAGRERRTGCRSGSLRLGRAHAHAAASWAHGAELHCGSWRSCGGLAMAPGGRPPGHALSLHTRRAEAGVSQCPRRRKLPADEWGFIFLRTLYVGYILGSFQSTSARTYFHKANCEIREVFWKSRGGLSSLLSGFCHFMTGTKLWFNIFITCE